MAKASEDRYYKRSGDSFYRMEHYDLEDMFGRRPHPKLELFARPVNEGGIGAAIVVGIKNTGRGLAKFPYLSLETQQPYMLSEYGLDGNRNTGLPILVDHKTTFYDASFGGSAATVIHPNSELGVTAIKLGRDYPRVTIETSVPSLVIKYSLCCEGILMQRGEYQVPGDSIKASFLRKW